MPWKVGTEKLGVEEWTVQLVQGMYANARSCVSVGEEYREEFEEKVGVHQGLVFSPLLFIIVLEALSHEFCSGVPWEDLHADDLVIITESLKECVRRLLIWKRSNGGEWTESKCRICGMGLDLLQSSGGFPCAILSHWSGQQQHLLQWLQALGAQEIQWAQVIYKGP